MTILKETVSLGYIGPGRRCDRPVHELAFTLSEQAAGRLQALSVDQWQSRLAELHPALRIDGHALQLDELLPAPLAFLFAGATLALQNAAGHRVNQAGLVESAPDHCRFWFEFEEPETGRQAAELIRDLLASLLSEASGGASPVARIDDFLAQAESRAMPADSLAIQQAAQARGIPVARMDRPPFDPTRGSFRIRPNGLLRLGHGRGQHTVDGTFAVSRSEPVFRLISDRVALFEGLAGMGVPLPAAAPGWQLSTIRVGRQAERLGYPVVIRCDRRGASPRTADPCRNREEVTRSATRALQSSRQVLVQRQIPGRACRVLVAGGCVIACQVEVEEADGRRWSPLERLHDSIGQLAVELARNLDVGLLLMSVVTADPERPLEEAGGAIVDVELAPRLDHLFPYGHPLLSRAAEAFVDWLFPGPAAARIPIIAVTGTNGKTTTSRLLTSIAAAAGYSVGEAGSEGCRVAGKQVSDYEDGHVYGHVAVLDNPATDFAVLESTRGAVATTGLGFERCDVAICLNVTADHVGDVVGLQHVEELAELKRDIVERADEAIVLNADDPSCLAMADGGGSRRVGLVSLVQSADKLLARAGPGGAAAVLESIDGREWLVLYADGQRKPLMAAGELPIAFDGSARFNLENALHAALAAWMRGIESDAIARGLAALSTGYGGVPGRLNFREDLSFRVCMDYAHNPAGIRNLCEFVDRLNVAGRRILCFSASNANADELIRATGEAAAGHFDAYICKNFGLLYDRQPHEGPQLLREGLIRGGVDPQHIQCVYDEFEAFGQALNMGRAGDLVVLIGGKRRQALWERVMAFQEVA